HKWRLVAHSRDPLEHLLPPNRCERARTVNAAKKSLDTECDLAHRNQGFALVITVILLSLLLLVLVSTATLTQIEASIGFNSRRQSQAQQNALFALSRSIGELQRHAGPDTRVTTSASIL